VAFFVGLSSPLSGPFAGRYENTVCWRDLRGLGKGGRFDPVRRCLLNCIY